MHSISESARYETKCVIMVRRDELHETAGYEVNMKVLGASFALFALVTGCSQSPSPKSSAASDTTPTIAPAKTVDVATILAKTETRLNHMTGIVTTATAFDGRANVKIRLMVNGNPSMKQATQLFQDILRVMQAESNAKDIWAQYNGHFDIKSYQSGVVYVANKTAGRPMTVRKAAPVSIFETPATVMPAWLKNVSLSSVKDITYSRVDFGGQVKTINSIELVDEIVSALHESEAFKNTTGYSMSGSSMQIMIHLKNGHAIGIAPIMRNTPSYGPVAQPGEYPPDKNQYVVVYLVRPTSVGDGNEFLHGPTYLVDKRLVLPKIFSWASAAFIYR